jgi:hypothetical protein
MWAGSAALFLFPFAKRAYNHLLLALRSLAFAKPLEDILNCCRFFSIARFVLFALVP